MCSLIQKSGWVVRALFYKLFFLDFKLPGYIGKPCFISGCSRISIGKRARIFPGIRIEVKKEALLSINDNVAIAQNVHITCGKSIEISSGVCIAGNVCITDTMHTYNNINCNVLEQSDMYCNTSIGENCFIGYGAVIDAGTKLGKHCIVGANSYVKGTFPDYCIIAGSPAKLIKLYDPMSKKWC